MTFKEFMARRYAEAEEFACGVTREQEAIAREAWEIATLEERERCAKIVDAPHFKIVVRNALKQRAAEIRALGDE